MSSDLSVAGARDHFSEVVNRAAFGGDITYITRGRNRVRAAAVVPADYAELIESLIDEQDGALAAKRLADIRAGKSKTVPMSEVRSRLGL